MDLYANDEHIFMLLSPFSSRIFANIFLRFHSRLMVQNVVLVQFFFNIIGINSAFSFGDNRFKTLIVKLGQACSTVEESNF